MAQTKAVAKAAKLDLAVLVDKNVTRLDISINYIAIV